MISFKKAKREFFRFMTVHSTNGIWHAVLLRSLQYELSIYNHTI